MKLFLLVLALFLTSSFAHAQYISDCCIQAKELDVRLGQALKKQVELQTTADALMARKNERIRELENIVNKNTAKPVVRRLTPVTDASEPPCPVCVTRDSVLTQVESNLLTEISHTRFLGFGRRTFLHQQLRLLQRR